MLRREDSFPQNRDRFHTFFTMNTSAYGGGHGVGGHGVGGHSGEDDGRSTQRSIGMATCDENFTADHRQFNDAIQDHYHPPVSIGGGTNINNNNNNNEYILDEDKINNNNNDNNNNDGDYEDNDDAATIEAMAAVTNERKLLKTENTAKLQTILDSVKNSTKMILREMKTYLRETEVLEKTYIQCRANTQIESRRMECVELDVLAATQGE